MDASATEAIRRGDSFRLTPYDATVTEPPEASELTLRTVVAGLDGAMSGAKMTIPLTMEQDPDEVFELASYWCEQWPAIGVKVTRLNRVIVFEPAG